MPRLTSNDWEKACQMWASGNFTLDELAEQFEITPTALHRRFKRDGIEKGQAREQLQEAMRRSVEDKANERAAELIEIAAQAKELHLKGTQMLSKRLLYEIKVATESKRSLAAIRDDIRAIQDASKVLHTNYQTTERILRLDREEAPDDDIPELRVRRMTDEDVQRLRAEQAREIEEMTAGFGGGADLDADDLVTDGSETPAGEG